jgi:hypothetical protein
MVCGTLILSFRLIRILTRRFARRYRRAHPLDGPHYAVQSWLSLRFHNMLHYALIPSRLVQAYVDCQFRLLHSAIWGQDALSECGTKRGLDVGTPRLSSFASVGAVGLGVEFMLAAMQTQVLQYVVCKSHCTCCTVTCSYSPVCTSLLPYPILLCFALLYLPFLCNHNLNYRGHPHFSSVYLGIRFGSFDCIILCFSFKTFRHVRTLSRSCCICRLRELHTIGSQGKFLCVRGLFFTW